MLKKGTQQYLAAVEMFGQAYVDKLLEDAVELERSLVSKGVAFKTFKSFAHFWQSASPPVRTKAVVSAASLFFGR